jgi:hypothetical protein
VPFNSPLIIIDVDDHPIIDWNTGAFDGMRTVISQTDDIHRRLLRGLQAIPQTRNPTQAQINISSYITM